RRCSSREGIAPFRSMIKDVIDHRDMVPITLIHVNRTHDAPFREELLGWRDDLGALDIHYVVSAAKGRLRTEGLRGVISRQIREDAVFYVAGPPGLVSSTTEMLVRLDIAREAINTDSFTGY
ncbi:MAG TPA: hypothetical protein VGQ85_02655, partial [Candidatus Limnocylindrales bacterium]|nr:hypothetical protein [Candidatus Limnocylindrales bacterium]